MLDDLYLQKMTRSASAAANSEVMCEICCTIKTHSVRIVLFIF